MLSMMQIEHTSSDRTAGFTLIELMIVVAIIAILTLVSLPSFIAYRQKSIIASCVATSLTIQKAMINYASGRDSATFPRADELSTWNQLVTICNQHGAALPETAGQAKFENWLSYVPVTVGSGTDIDDFYLIMRAGGGISRNTPGSQIQINSAGVVKQTY